MIFLSSVDDKGLIVRALESGGVDYITKPFNHAELVTRVRTDLALKKARDELKQLAEDRDESLGILAHDLKNHLGGMDMSAQLLRDRTEAMAENISHYSGQMLTFAKEFLANASADHGLNLKTEPVMRAVMHGIWRVLEETRSSNNLILIGEHHPGAPYDISLLSESFACDIELLLAAEPIAGTPTIPTNLLGTHSV
jgi:DNA-binding response OmpR family regulator